VKSFGEKIFLFFCEISQKTFFFQIVWKSSKNKFFFLKSSLKLLAISFYTFQEKDFSESFVIQDDEIFS